MKKHRKGRQSKISKWLITGLSGTAVLAAAFASAPAFAGPSQTEEKNSYSYVVEDAKKSDYPSPERLDEMFAENDRLYAELVLEQEKSR